MPVVVEFFAPWSLPFWLLLLAECTLLFWAVSSRRGLMALLSLVAFAGLIQFLGGVPVLESLWHNPLGVLAAVGVYLGAAVPWAFVKWWLFVTNNLHRYDEILADYRQSP